MTNRFMISVAVAALLAGTGFANAQGTGTSPGSTVQQGAPSSAGTSATPMNRDAAEPTKPSSGVKATQSDDKAMQPNGVKNQRAQDDMKVGPKGEKSAQDNNMKGEKKSMSSETNSPTGGKDMKAEGRDSKPGNMNADSKSGNMNAQTKGTADSKTGATSTESKTTGNAATSATAAPPAEKQTQIASAIKQVKVEEVTNVNFNLSVGTVVPSSVRYHPLPVQIVEIYPEWRGYDFIFVHGRYIILRPRTHEIVYIIEG
jgi:Protein of unknown function (DUF1236)